MTRGRICIIYMHVMQVVGTLKLQSEVQKGIGEAKLFCMKMVHLDINSLRLTV